MVKRRLVLAIAALLVAVLAIVGVRMVDSCRPEYTYIAPDGEEFPLTHAGLMPGSSASLEPLEGEGLPGVEWTSVPIYQMPGEIVTDYQIPPRVMTFVASLYADSRAGLWRVRARLYDALRPGRGPSRTSPGILRVTYDGTVREIEVHYSTLVQQQQGRFARNVVVGIRFISFTVFWYDPATQEQVLDYSDAMTATRIVRRDDGIWSNMNGGADGTVFDVLYHSSGYVYASGGFVNIGGIPANYFARYNPLTNAWNALGVGLDNVGYALTEAADGRIYIGGNFANAGGNPAARVAVYDPVTAAYSALGVGVDNNAYAVTVGVNGLVYFAGDFHNAGGAGALHIASWDPATLAWAALGAGADDSVRALARGSNGNIFAGGLFHNAGGAAALHIAEWDPVVATWAPLGAGTDDWVWSMAVAADGLLYAGGSFTTAGGVTANRIARWNGVSWSACGDGVNGTVYVVRLSPEGIVYLGGTFTTAGGLTLYDRMACWNGFSWFGVDADLPGAPSARCFAFLDEHDWVVGFDTAGAGTFSGAVTATNEGSAFALPIIEIKNQGTLQSIQNETTGHRIQFNLYVNDGEVVTVDLSVGKKTVGSNFRPNLLDYVLPNSDLGTFCLESDPRASDGDNTISAFITGTAARERNDNNNQLSGWDNITGISQGNTDLGRLYASIVAGVTNHVNFYMDAARTELVGHTANYNAAGAVVVNEDNGSGLGGTITVDAGGWPGANDTDIYVYFTICTLSWRARWWSLDEAVLAATP